MKCNSLIKGLSAVLMLILSCSSNASQSNNQIQNNALEFGLNSTHLRCYYRDYSGPLKLGTNRLWAKINDQYYTLTGQWDDPFSLVLNSFHTTAQYSEVEQACIKTLKAHHITAELAGMAAANSDLSWDYRINTSLQTNSTGYNKIVAFGDSLTDLHNSYIGTFNVFPNGSSWYWGRFSNGPLWVEQLGKLMKLPVDVYAQANTRTDTQNIAFLFPYLLGLQDQVNLWVKTSAKDQDADRSKMLFTVITGGNDLAQTNITPREISARIKIALNVLVLNGAKNIILLTVPDITKSPYYTDYRPNLIEQDRRRVTELNAELTDLAKQITNSSDTKVTLFDTSKLYDQIIQNPSNYGITLVDQSCLDIVNDSLMFAVSHPLRSICPDPDKALFWDIFHPTARVGQIWAEALYKQLLAKQP